MFPKILGSPTIIKSDFSIYFETIFFTLLGFMKIPLRVEQFGSSIISIFAFSILVAFFISGLISLILVKIYILSIYSKYLFIMLLFIVIP